MNLIEQLGGYERASKIANCKSGVVHPTKPLLDALLEYRRANNIFEVGDKVIHKWENDELHTVMSHTKDHTVIISERNFIGISGGLHNCIRHATNEEIKAGHRISHTDNLSHFDQCSDIANHISLLTKVTER